MANHRKPDDAEEQVDGDSAPKGGRPGPVDEGKSGGMATRELAPEVAEDN